MTVRVTPADDLQAVFDTAPAGATVRLAPGIYRQKLMIKTPGLTLVGSGPEKTVIVWDDHANFYENFYKTMLIGIICDCCRHSADLCAEQGYGCRYGYIGRL